MIFFLFLFQNIDCGYTLEPPRRGGSNEYPQSMFWSKNKKKGIPLHTPVLLYKSGFNGIYITRTCFPDIFQGLYCMWHIYWHRHHWSTVDLLWSGPNYSGKRRHTREKIFIPSYTENSKASATISTPETVSNSDHLQWYRAGIYGW